MLVVGISWAMLLLASPVQAQRTLTLIASDALRITEVLDTGTTQFTRTETFSRQRR